MATVEQLEKLRRRIGDSSKKFVDRFEGDGNTTEYGLSYHNVFNVVVSINGSKRPDGDYKVVASSGQILFLAAPEMDAVVDVEYSYAGYSDEQLKGMIDTYGVNGAAVECLQELLADSARLYDYQQGQTSDKRSQVFDHLKDLLASAKEAANGTTGYGLVFGRRQPDIRPIHAERLDLTRSDIWSSNNV